MKIEFFETKDGLDPRSVKGGVYHIELIKIGNEQNPISLYIGESAWIANRCGNHLYAFFENPQYFGLTPTNFNDNTLILRFSVLDQIDEKKSVLGVGKYKNEELKYIQRIKPLTQLETSDRQLEEGLKSKRVQDKILEMWG